MHLSLPEHKKPEAFAGFGFFFVAWQQSGSGIVPEPHLNPAIFHFPFCPIHRSNR
jgi:hypothetical protein